MVCCWISIITNSGLPVAQFSSDALPLPFSVQGVLSALQSNASVCQAKIRCIETELADIAYQSGPETMLICTMGRPFQKLTMAMLNNVQSCLKILDCYRNVHSNRQLIQDIKVLNPIISKLLSNSQYWLHWIGLPVYLIHKSNSFVENLISVARCFSETDCAAIGLQNGSLIRSSAGWSALIQNDIWAIALLGYASDADPFCEYSIKLTIHGVETEKRLIIIRFLQYFICIVASVDSTKTKDVVAALNQFKESDSALEQIRGGFGIRGYYLMNSSSASIWLDEGEKHSEISQILIEEYCQYLETKLAMGNIGGEIEHIGQCTVAKEWAVYWSRDDQSFNLAVIFSNEVPQTCFEYAAKKLLEYLKPYQQAILE